MRLLCSPFSTVPRIQRYIMCVMEPLVLIFEVFSIVAHFFFQVIVLALIVIVCISCSRTVRIEG